jgi:hypothetical protein
VKGKNGNTALKEAMKYGTKDIAQLLLKEMLKALDATKTLRKSIVKDVVKGNVQAPDSQEIKALAEKFLGQKKHNLLGAQ